MLAPGSLLEGRYKIEKILGSGGMGAVYLASDTRLPRKWAVKEMAEKFEDEEQRKFAEESFSAEAAMLSTLNHPNLPRIGDYFQTEGRHYLVMDYIEGETLEAALRDKPLPLDKALDVGKQLASVLTYLHTQAKPIIFRDLKPANIILTPDGQVKLIDFGIARLLRPDASSDTRALGTPGYAAPEQYGRGQSDARTDLFALGATLHHALSGRDPSETPFQFPGLRSLRPEAPEALERVLSKAVSLKPDERYQTAAEFMQTLESLKQDPEAYCHLPAGLKTSFLPPPPTEGFQPASIFLGQVPYGHRATTQVVLHGDVDGKIKSEARWVRPRHGRVKGKDPIIDLEIDTSRLREGGRQSTTLRFRGQPEVAGLRVEVDVLPRKLASWAYPVAILLSVASIVPILGVLSAFLLLMMLMGAPPGQKGGLRFMFWLSALLSTGWLTAIGAVYAFSIHIGWLGR